VLNNELYLLIRSWSQKKRIAMFTDMKVCILIIELAGYENVNKFRHSITVFQ